MSKLFIISAPSGGGKTSLNHKLIKNNKNITKSISFTTRNIRPNERDGVDYHFISPEAFQQKINAGDFLEYAVVFGNMYGTSYSWITEKLNHGIDVILEIDWQGAQQIRKKMSDILSIFILPPSLDHLKSRLITRNQDDSATIARRLTEASIEISHYHEYDYLIVNDNFDAAFTELNTIIQASRLTCELQTKKYQRLIESLIV